MTEKKARQRIPTYEETSHSLPLRPLFFVSQVLQDYCSYSSYRPYTRNILIPCWYIHCVIPIVFENWNSQWLPSKGREPEYLAIDLHHRVGASFRKSLSGVTIGPSSSELLKLDLVASRLSSRCKTLCLIGALGACEVGCTDPLRGSYTWDIFEVGPTVGLHFCSLNE